MTTDTMRALWQRKALWSVLATYMARGVAVVVYLVSVPLALSYFDQERYGLWLTISSMVAYLNVTDLGLGLGLQNRVAEARGQRDEDSLSGLLTTAIVAMLAMGGLVASVGVAVVSVAPLDRWFHLSSAQVTHELNGALLITVLTFVCLLPMRMVASAQNGFQESYYSEIWNIVGSVFSLLAVWMVVAWHGDLVALVTATFFLTQLPSLMGIVHFFKRHSHMRWQWRAVHLKWFKVLFALGWQFFLLQIYTLLIWQTDNLVIATQLGAEQVVPYAVAFRLMWLPLNLLSSVPSALWPAYTEAKARNDWEWIQATYRRVTVGLILLASLIAAVLFVWGQEFIVGWAGDSARGSVTLMAGLCFYLVISVWTNCNAIMVNAIGRPLEQVVSGLVDALLNLSLSLLLIRVWGIAGVAWGTMLACLCISSWFLAWSIWRSTEHRVRPPWSEALRLSALPLLVSLIVGEGVAQLLPSLFPLLRLALGVSAMCAAYGLTVYFTVPLEWRAWLHDRFQRLYQQRQWLWE